MRHTPVLTSAVMYLSAYVYAYVRVRAHVPVCRDTGILQLVLHYQGPHNRIRLRHV